MLLSVNCYFQTFNAECITQRDRLLRRINWINQPRQWYTQIAEHRNIVTCIGAAPFGSSTLAFQSSVDSCD